VALLIAAPVVAPVFWLVGALLVAVRRPAGWLATLAMCPLGLFAPLWLYGRSLGDGATLSPYVGVPAAVALTIGSLVAAWRLTSRPL
jgi:hypothetical protein